MLAPHSLALLLSYGEQWSAEESVKGALCLVLSLHEEKDIRGSWPSAFPFSNAYSI